MDAKSLNKNSTFQNMKMLMLAECMRTVSNIFLGTFLIAYFFNNSGENVFAIATYLIITYATVALTSYLTGDWLKRRNRLAIYRLGIIFYFIYMLIIIFLQDKIVLYLPFCGILYGLGMACKAFPWNLIVSDNVNKDEMIKFRGYLEGFKGIIKISAPFLLGLFLTIDSYNRTVGFLSLLIMAELFVTMFIRISPKLGTPPFNLSKFFHASHNKTILKDVYRMEFFRGMALEGALETIITLYIVYLFKTDFNLGMITSFFYGVTIMVNLWFGRFCKYHHFGKILLSSSIIMITASFLFCFYPGKETFIIYNFCFVSAVQLLRIMTDVNMFNVANTSSIKTDYKNEYFVIRELFLNFGRIISYSLLLLYAFYGNFEILKYLLVTLTIFLALMGISSIYLNTHLQKEFTTNQKSCLDKE